MLESQDSPDLFLYDFLKAHDVMSTSKVCQGSKGSKKLEFLKCFEDIVIRNRFSQIPIKFKHQTSVFLRNIDVKVT